MLYSIRPTVNSRERIPPTPPYPRVGHCTKLPHRDHHVYLDFMAIGILVVGVRSADPYYVHHPWSRVFPTKQRPHCLRHQRQTTQDGRGEYAARRHVSPCKISEGFMLRTKRSRLDSSTSSESSTKAYLSIGDMSTGSNQHHQALAVQTVLHDSAKSH